MTVGNAYVDGPQLARSVFAAADRVAAGRDEINRINVFPVPDGDTGTNFSLTLRAVANALRALGDAPLSETARTSIAAITVMDEPDRAPLVPAAGVDVIAERDFQYCTEILIRAFGGSAVVALIGDMLEIHVHTDTPEAVFSHAERWGRVDLPDSVLDRHGIAVVPLQVMFGNSTFRDRVELKPEDFYRRLREAAELPTTSQPTPALHPGIQGCPAGSGRSCGGAAQVKPLGHLRICPGSRPSRWPARRPPGGHPAGVAWRGPAGAARGRAGDNGLFRHADCREAYRGARRTQDCFVTLATGVLGTQVGPGAWGISYQVEDGFPDPLDEGAALDG